jgi:Flp pilus assembly protein TadG
MRRVWWFLVSRRGDLVWNTIILVAVFLPLAGLAIDVPRYFALRSRLQLACDAAAQAAAQAVDIGHFMDTGQVRLRSDACGQAGWAFAAATENLHAAVALDSCQVDEAGDGVLVQGSGVLQPFYNLGPAVRVRATAASRYRMVQR